VKGRKRHILVDTLGLLLTVVVHAANLQNRDGAKLVLDKRRGKFLRLALIWADGGYAGKLIEWVKDACGWVLEIVGLPGRQRRLRREAREHQLLGGAKDGGSGPQVWPHRPIRNAEPQCAIRDQSKRIYRKRKSRSN